VAQDFICQRNEWDCFVKQAWHLFKIRRALLTDKSLCFSIFGAPNCQIRLPEIQNAAASILYVNAVSLLHDAIETRLTPAELAKIRTLGKRLEALRDRGDLQSYGTLDHIRNRRNEIGHEYGKDATLEELDQACTAIQNQLSDWGLIVGEPPYTLYFERSAMRGSPDPKVAFEQDQILRVVRDAEWVFEAKNTVQVYRLKPEESNS
jgi:hypothetical protein